MSLYHDPSLPYQRPSLVGGLLGVPATTSQHQLENQATTVLAWLVDRSDAVGRTVLRLFVGDDVPDGRIGARTQLSLRKPGGGAFYPDLSICVEDRKLQLIVEVKVDSDFHVYAEFGNRLQPDVYRLLWAPRSPQDADVRAVGTLTRAGSARLPDTGHLVARDISWSELRDAVGAQLAEDGVEREVRLVADSFVAAIDARIAPKPPNETEQAAFFATHRSLLDRVASEVERLLVAPARAKPISGRAFVGWRIRLLDTNETPLFIRIYLSPAGSRLNLPGAPDALIAAPERDANGLLEAAAAVAAEAAGFFRTKDLDGYWLHRRLWPLSALVAEDAAGEIAEAVRVMGLLRIELEKRDTIS